MFKLTAPELRPWTSTGVRPGITYWYGETGWRVEHCGHPTALFPYLIYTPEGEAILAPNGRAWRTVAEAKAATVKLHAGKRVAHMTMVQRQAILDDEKQRPKRRRR